LGVTNVGGIFVVLLGKNQTIKFIYSLILYLGGVVLSLCVAILEFLWHARKNHANRRVTFHKRLTIDLRSFLFLAFYLVGIN